MANSALNEVGKRAVKGLAAKTRANGMMDAIANLATGLGTGRDKTKHAHYFDEPPIAQDMLESLFANNDLAYTIVTKPVDDALREWFCIEREEPTEDEEESARKIQDEFVRLNARCMLKEAAIFGRLFGHAGVILLVKGGGQQNMPLDDEEIDEVLELIPYNRSEMTARSWYKNGEVQTYIYNPTPVGGGPVVDPQEIHTSRLLSFVGARTTKQRRKINMGWHLSCLQRVYDVLKSFDQMWGSVDAMFADASQAVFKMQGLIEALAEADGEGKDDVTARLAFMDMVRSASKAVMLDAGNKGQGEEGESFEVVERATLGTLEGVINTYMVRLCTAARMPLTVLMGTAPAGMDATGESDLILHYNNVDIYRLEDLEPNALRLVRILARTTSDSDPESWLIKWPELARPKPLDVATADKMNMDAVCEAVVNQILLPEEAALNLKRFAKSLNLRIDLKSRKSALKDGLAEVENREVGLGKMENESEVQTSQAVTVAKAKPKPAAGQTARSSGRKTPAKAAKRQV